MQLVFVYKAQAKSDTDLERFNLKAPDGTAQPHRSDRQHSLCIHFEEIGISLTCWKAAEKREIGAMHFFYFTAPVLGNKEM